MTDSKKPHFGQTFNTGAAPTSPGPPNFRFQASYAAVPIAGGATAPLPDNAQACNAQGNSWLMANRLADAVRAYDRAIVLKPDYVDPHFNRGNALLRLQRNAEALASFEQAIALAPGLALAHYNRGTILQGLGRLQEAVDSYRQVLALEPGNMQARFNLGCIHLERKEFSPALACMEQVIAHAPQVPEAHNNKGIALLHLGKLGDAIACFTQALALRPQYADAYNNRGDAYSRQEQYPLAFQDLTNAQRLQPDRLETRHLLGNLLRYVKRYEEAALQLQWVCQRSPEHPYLLGDLVQAKLNACDWNGIEHDLQRIREAVIACRPAVDPFTLLALADDPLLHLECAQTLVGSAFPPSSDLAPVATDRQAGKLRVGYYSADLHNHATALLMAELFERHGREGFEWFAFSYGPDVQDAMRQRLSAAFDHFIDVRERSDLEIAQLSRDLHIDIAVDLKGFTQHHRFGIFAHRCAPVQVSYLGYPGTTGADYMDYVIADKVVIPERNQSHYTEKVAYLPHSYQVNDGKRKISDRMFTREEAGLPLQGFVFCCFNNNYKIQPATFDGWMRILQAVDGSVLWLLEDNPMAGKNLRREAGARGVDPARLVFAPRMLLEDHLARHSLADLFLDTLPYNAHTTTSDALWAGLPVLTCMGESFASRVAASLLQAVGLPELVAQTPQAYEARAIELARDAAQLQGLRERLRTQGRSSALFDAKQFARHIESLYATMHERWMQGLPPEVIQV